MRLSIDEVVVAGDASYGRLKFACKRYQPSSAASSTTSRSQQSEATVSLVLLHCVNTREYFLLYPSEGRPLSRFLR